MAEKIKRDYFDALPTFRRSRKDAERHRIKGNTFQPAWHLCRNMHDCTRRLLYNCWKAKALQVCAQAEEESPNSSGEFLVLASAGQQWSVSSKSGLKKLSL